MIGSQRLEHVVGVGDVSSSSLVVGHFFSLLKDLSSCVVVSLQHLNCEDVVNLNVMSRESVVEEGRGEDHLVSGEPELRVVLIVEGKGVSSSDESESVQDQEREPPVHEDHGV